MVILRTRNKITDFFMILAWASPFNRNTNKFVLCFQVNAQKVSSNAPAVSASVVPGDVTVIMTVEMVPMKLIVSFNIAISCVWLVCVNMRQCPILIIIDVLFV